MSADLQKQSDQQYESEKKQSKIKKLATIHCQTYVFIFYYYYYSRTTNQTIEIHGQIHATKYRNSSIVDFIARWQWEHMHIM